MSHTYKRNYLRQVIFRVDFDHVGIEGFDAYRDFVQKHFDVSERRKATEGSLQIDSSGVEFIDKPTNVDIWSFENSRTKNKLELSSTHCLLEYYSYVNSEELHREVGLFLGKFIQDQKVKEARRIGLRYINEIELPLVKKVGDWKKFIQPDLLSHQGFIGQKDRALTRTLTQIEFKLAELNVVFKYGIWNNKYPSPATNSAFILDIDCSSRLPVALYQEEDLTTWVPTLNAEAESIFEEAITDELRKEMEK